jgi:putative toxin-antitoxin system antitoxin component (TIGR02293 family)
MRTSLARKEGRAAASRSTSYKTAGSSLGLAADSTPGLIRELHRGLPFRSLEFLSSESGIAIREIAPLVGIPPRTLARRKVSGRLAPAESERLLRVSRIFELAVGLFHGSVADGVVWLRTPRRSLAGHSPLAYSATEVGAREVENLIGQLEHGVFP